MADTVSGPAHIHELNTGLHADCPMCVEIEHRVRLFARDSAIEQGIAHHFREARRNREVARILAERPSTGTS